MVVRSGLSQYALQATSPGPKRGRRVQERNELCEKGEGAQGDNPI